MSIDFTKYQKDICEEVPKPPPLRKLCSTCTPNPNYIEPNWRQMVDSPYLNEKTCEYMVCVTVKEDGRGFKSTPRDPFPSTPEGQARLLSKYKHPAMVLMLEYYG